MNNIPRSIFEALNDEGRMLEDLAVMGLRQIGEEMTNEPIAVEKAKKDAEKHFTEIHTLHKGDTVQIWGKPKEAK